MERLVGMKASHDKGLFDFWTEVVLRVGDVRDMSLASYKSAFMRALLDLRFVNPSTACHAAWGIDKDPQAPHVQYRPFESQAEAKAWADSVVTIRREKMTADELNAERTHGRLASGAIKSAGSVEFIFVSHSESEDAILAPGHSIQIIAFFNHVFWDGKARLFQGELLQRAAKIIDEGNEWTMPGHNWGEEVQRLDTPILDALKVPLNEIDAGYKDAQQHLLDSQMKIGVSLVQFPSSNLNHKLWGERG